MTSQKIIRHLKKLADPAVAEHAKSFMKTGEGEYGHGDKFLGVRVPKIRQAVKQFRDTSLADAKIVLKSEFHEIRLFALLLMVAQYGKGDEIARARIYKAYLDHTRYINGWDLVDTTAPHIVGAHLLHRDREVLYRLARSKQLWRRRIAMLSTHHFIRHHQFDDTLSIARLLLGDSEDLIHKAVGWMLREVGNRDRKTQEIFLKQHYRIMPRTMLRYAIEKFTQARRQAYLKGKV